MGIRVKTNVDSLVAQRRLGETRRNLGESLEKLSSGLRINKSSDDAAGLAVSEAIRARTSSLNVAKRNASDGISYIQVAEGGLNEVTNIVIRMRELTTQAASDTLSNRERGFLNKEFVELAKEAARIVDATEFNGTKLLQSSEDDSDKVIQMFVGASFRGTRPGDSAPPEIPKDLDPDLVTINIGQLKGLEEAITEVAALELVPGGDGAVDESFGADTLGSGEEGGTAKVLGVLDDGLSRIAEYRATLGSVQSRLNSTITNIDISSENLLAAQSRIRDVDYAQELAKFTQTQILSAAGVSVLSQANQVPEAVLQLLR
jgi:flagellin